MPRASEGGRDERNSVAGHRFSLMPENPRNAIAFLQSGNATLRAHFAYTKSMSLTESLFANDVKNYLKQSMTREYCEKLANVFTINKINETDNK